MRLGLGVVGLGVVSHRAGIRCGGVRGSLTRGWNKV